MGMGEQRTPAGALHCCSRRRVPPGSTAGGGRAYLAPEVARDVPGKQRGEQTSKEERGGEDLGRGMEGGREGRAILSESIANCEALISTLFSAIDCFLGG